MNHPPQPHSDQQGHQSFQVGIQQREDVVLHLERGERAPELYESHHARDSTGSLSRYEAILVLRHLQHEVKNAGHRPQQRICSQRKQGHQRVADQGESLVVGSGEEP